MTISTFDQRLAVDAPRDQRPGVPMEVEPRKVGHAHWDKPTKQMRNPRVTKDSQRDELTATYGSAQTPAGLSGVIRRYAYTIPDYEVKRWVLLMLADRIDWQESRIGRAARNPFTWLAVAGVLGAVAYRKKRRVDRWSLGHWRHLLQ